ncbi:MAG: ATP-binding cassette domain-containing protein, partial [Vibrio casei]
MNPFLQVSNLSIKSGDVTLINNISFSLTNENPLIILGQTGSGKSLLLKFIMGTLDPKLHVTGQFFISGNE